MIFLSQVCVSFKGHFVLIVFLIHIRSGNINKMFLYFSAIKYQLNFSATWLAWQCWTKAFLEYHGVRMHRCVILGDKLWLTPPWIALLFIIYIFFSFFYRNFWIVFWALPRHCLSVSVSTCADNHVYVRTCMYVFFPLLCEWLNVCLYQSIHFLLESDQRPR